MLRKAVTYSTPLSPPTGPTCRRRHSDAPSPRPFTNRRRRRPDGARCRRGSRRSSPKPNETSTPPKHRQPPPPFDEPKRTPRSAQRMRRWPPSPRRPLMTVTRCATRQPAPSRHDATTPTHNAGSRRHRAASDARPRNDLDVADRRLERVETSLATTRERTAPAIDLHHDAVTDQRDAHEALRTCDMLDRLDTMTPSVGEHRTHVRALEVWKHWADGHPVSRPVPADRRRHPQPSRTPTPTRRHPPRPRPPASSPPGSSRPTRSDRRTIPCPRLRHRALSVPNGRPGAHLASNSGRPQTRRSTRSSGPRSRALPPPAYRAFGPPLRSLPSLALGRRERAATRTRNIGWSANAPGVVLDRRRPDGAQWSCRMFADA